MDDTQTDRQTLGPVGLRLRSQILSKTCLKEQIRIQTVGTEEDKMFLEPGTITVHYCTVNV